MELVAMQVEEQPAEIQLRWKTYVTDAYNSSPVLREHLASCAAWYADDLLRLLPTEPVDSAPEKFAKTDASDSAVTRAAGATNLKV